MKNLLAFILLLTCTNGFSQKSLTIKDAVTKQGLPYATAECFKKQWGNYADSSGNVSITKLNDDDSVFISFVGYESKTVLYKELKEEIFLIQKNRLEDVVVKNCSEFKINKLETNNGKSPIGFNFGLNKISAVYIKNEYGKSGIVDKLHYRISTTLLIKSKRAPFRLRFYEYDTVRKVPAKEILDSSIIVYPKKFGKNSIDVSSYKIKMPLNGIIVAFETFDAGPQYRYRQVKTDKFLSYGFFLKGWRDKNAMGFFKYPGKDWSEKDYSGVDRFAPYTKLEIKVCKK